MPVKKAAGYTLDMTNGPLLSKMLVFALPLMLSTMLQLLFNAADLVVVSRFAGDNAMAAVGLQARPKDEPAGRFSLGHGQCPNSIDEMICNLCQIMGANKNSYKKSSGSL